jgi:hypothetical protein
MITIELEDKPWPLSSIEATIQDKMQEDEDEEDTEASLQNYEGITNTQ